MPELDFRNLPAAVLERLVGHDVDLAAQRLQTVQRGRVLEARVFASAELRMDDAGNPTLDGYATVYEYPYDIAGGAPYGWSETMAEGACLKSVRERDDVRLLVNHDGIPLARTRSKTLELESDEVGLRCAASLDGASPLVAAARSAMERGDLDEMSLAFQVLRQEWNDDYTERRILEVKLFDVSVVTYPANPATVAQLRGSAPVEPAPARGLDLRTASAVRDQLALGAR